jgi:MFS transporter, NNP family, nitrate/nitrite transporter
VEDKTMAKITHWNPEDEKFWNSGGSKIAKKNLWISVPALMIAFIVWQIWSVVAIRLNDVGFNFSQEQLFTLAALPGLVGATLRFFYIFGIGKFGGRNWIAFSTAVLLIPAIGIGYAVQDPTTSYGTMMLLAALCGLGGGNLSSASAHISFFYPKKEKGGALGILVGLGNMGVSVVQFVTPIIIATSTFAFIGNGQTLPDGSTVWIQNAAFIWVIPIIILTLAAYFGLDNLPNVKQSPKEQFAIIKRKHTWVMTFLYVGTFGSLIGYGAAFPLLLKSQFPEHAGLAFLGVLIAAAVRPIGGIVSDKIGGSLVTFYVYVVQTLGAVAVVYFTNEKSFSGFLISFLILFAASGIGSGSTFQMIPNIFIPKEAAPVLGFTAAFAAYGSFFIPKLFGWSSTNFGTPVNAFYIFIAIYVISIFVNWYYYQRKNAEVKC